MPYLCNQVKQLKKTRVMEVYVVEVLVEDIDSNSVSTEVFVDRDLARAFAESEIDAYARDYENAEVEKTSDYYTMHTGDTYVTAKVLPKVLVDTSEDLDQ